MSERHATTFSTTGSTSASRPPASYTRTSEIDRRGRSPCQSVARAPTFTGRPIEREIAATISAR